MVSELYLFIYLFKLSSVHVKKSIYLVLTPLPKLVVLGEAAGCEEGALEHVRAARGPALGVEHGGEGGDGELQQRGAAAKVEDGVSDGVPHQQLPGAIVLVAARHLHTLSHQITFRKVHVGITPTNIKKMWTVSVIQDCVPPSALVREKYSYCFEEMKNTFDLQQIVSHHSLLLVTIHIDYNENGYCQI